MNESSAFVNSSLVEITEELLQLMRLMKVQFVLLILFVLITHHVAPCCQSLINVADCSS